jgi:hypothetical protein
MTGPAWSAARNRGATPKSQSKTAWRDSTRELVFEPLDGQLKTVAW